MLLGGDLGGTKTLLALAEIVDGRPRIVREARFDSPAYGCFEDLLAEFLAGSAGIGSSTGSGSSAAPVGRGIASACFGLAGPTDGCSAQLTYLPWRLDAAALANTFGFGRVTLVNDFASAAHGLARLEPGQLLTLQGGAPVERAPRVILGAGTGLGVAGLVWEETWPESGSGSGSESGPERGQEGQGQDSPPPGRYRVISGEGGHMGFSPQTPEQAALWAHLFAGSGRVTVEDVVSGPGLGRIYNFLAGAEKSPAEIGAAAVAGSDPAAVASLDLWLAAYGAFAGDLALQWLARGGVFIAGGVGAKLLPHTSAQPFLAAFNAKRAHRRLTEATPVYLVTEERLGLLGALELAARCR